LYSSVCSEAILGAFHDRIVFRELSESACDYKHNQLVYGVQECYGSVMIQYGNIFVLMVEDYFRHQQCLYRSRCHLLVSHSLRDGFAFGTRPGLV